MQAARGEDGDIVIGVTTSAILHPLVSRVIAALSRRHPRVEMTIREGNAADITESLERGAMGVGFLRAPVSRPAGVVFRELLAEEMIAVVPADHALAGRANRGIALTELAGERFVLTRRPSMPGMYDDLLQACRTAGFEPRVAAEVGRMLTNINLVAAGIGVSVVPASMRKIRLPGVRYARLLDARGLRAPLTVAAMAGNENPVVNNLLQIVDALNGGEQSRAGPPRPPPM